VDFLSSLKQAEETHASEAPGSGQAELVTEVVCLRAMQLGCKFPSCLGSDPQPDLERRSRDEEAI